MGTVTNMYQWKRQRQAPQSLDSSFLPGVPMGARLAYLRADHAETWADVEARRRYRSGMTVIGMVMTLAILFILMYACRAGGIT